MGTDDINDIPEVSGEVIDDSGHYPITSDANDLPDPSAVCQRLYDKIRSILVNLLLATDVKKRNLRYFSRTLWQHMWIFGPTEGFSGNFLSLENIMGEPGSGLLNMSPLDKNMDI
jgi:hypothetical protein